MTLSWMWLCDYNFILLSIYKQVSQSWLF